MSDGLDWMDQALDTGLPESVAAMVVPPPVPTTATPAQETGPRPGEFVQSCRVVLPETTVEIAAKTIIAAESYEPHPESYFPRVFTFVREDQTYYELLKTGRAIPRKASPEGRGFDLWVTDTDYVANVGVYRAATGRRS